jgi:uncharacterized protein
MRLCASLPIIPFLLLGASCLSAGRSPDPTRARLETSAHVTALTQSDFTVLSSRAETGDREAQYWLGCLYAQGGVVPIDTEQARRWFLKSANQGYPPAQRALGMSYWMEDRVKAASWLQPAARHGDAEAQFFLGAAYEDALSGTANYKEARYWFEKSAKQGHPDAQFCLGQMYEQAFGVNENDRMAAKWYRRAAEHVPDLGGAGQGRNGLAILYQRGTGVPKDYLKAYMWLSLGNGDLSYLKTQMTPVEILDAERMADEWRSRHRAP